jgi:hypothetical protein
MKLLHPLLVPIGAAAVFIAGACAAPTSSKTKYDCLTTGTGDTVNHTTTQADTQAIFSINGGPANGPSAVNTCIPQPVIARPASLFDFAVDIEGTQAFVLPPSAVSSAGAAGWLSTDTAYDLIKEAPTIGYNDTTPLAIAPGSVFLIQAIKPGCSGLPYTSQHYIYSKFIIDSIHYYPYNPVTAPSGLTVYYRMVSDPICGYTSLAPGIPAN